jgi:hypothetical protein
MPEIATQTTSPSAPPHPNGSSTDKHTPPIKEIKGSWTEGEIKGSWTVGFIISGRKEMYIEIEEESIDPQLRLNSFLEECRQIQSDIEAHHRVINQRVGTNLDPAGWKQSEETAQLKKLPNLISRTERLVKDFKSLHDTTESQVGDDTQLKKRALNKVGLSAGLTLNTLMESLEMGGIVVLIFSLLILGVTIISIIEQWFLSWMLVHAAVLLAATTVSLVCNTFDAASAERRRLKTTFNHREDHRNAFTQAANKLNEFCEKEKELGLPDETDGEVVIPDNNEGYSERVSVAQDAASKLGNAIQAVSSVPELWLKIQDEKDAQPGVISQLMSLFKAPFVWIIKALGLGPATKDGMTTTGDDPTTMPIAIAQPLKGDSPPMQHVVVLGHVVKGTSEINSMMGPS